MKRLPILAAAIAIGVASSGVIATAQDNAPERPDTAQGPGAMLFERFDSNGDGTITREEIEADKAARFAAVDSDGDGQLSAAEIAAAQEARRIERQQARIERMIERLDANDDGVLSAEEMAADGPRGDIFDRLDADEDGVITLAELEEVRDGHRGGGRGHGHGEGRGHDRDHGKGHGKGPWWGKGRN